MNLYTTWMTSDTHYGHANVIKYSKRPFSCVEEMDEVLIDNHNSVVKSSDTVIHLGDFAFSPADRIQEILNRLNGKYIFLPGNHDNQFWKNKKLLDRFENASQLYEITKQIESAKFNMNMEVKYDNGAMGGLIVMQHYAGLVWNRSHHGAIMLHGHSHGSLRYPKPMRIMDVGVDPMKYFPIKLYDVVNQLEKIPVPTFDHQGE